MSITLRPRLRAASRSCSNACRGLDPVPLGQYADRLLDPDPGGERVLELADGRAQPAQPRRRAAACRRPAWRGRVAACRSRPQAGRRGSSRRSGRAGRRCRRASRPWCGGRPRRRARRPAAGRAVVATGALTTVPLDQRTGGRPAAAAELERRGHCVGRPTSGARARSLPQRHCVGLTGSHLAAGGPACRSSRTGQFAKALLHVCLTGSSSRCHPGRRRSGPSGSRR